MLHFNLVPKPMKKLDIWPRSTALPWLNNSVYFDCGVHLTYIIAILYPALVRARVTSIQSSSFCPYWNSALSFRCKLNVLGSSEVMVYVGSGGRNANFAAIFEGHGGQQNKQQNSVHDSEFMLKCLSVCLLLCICIYWVVIIIQPSRCRLIHDLKAQ